mgnify:CR=1 FL=1
MACRPQGSSEPFRDNRWVDGFDLSHLGSGEKDLSAAKAESPIERERVSPSRWDSRTERGGKTADAGSFDLDRNPPL